ncbi:MAG TPA: glutamate synthase-related protein [bacterium]|mgnify:CR=1 FL=1|nr:glutamate synthase-related protein [bacterium]
MPEKYHIDIREAEPRFTPVGKYSIIDMYEQCARGCRNCVKRKCVYDIHKHHESFIRDMKGPVTFLNECMNCLSCVQDCTRGALTRVVNPEFRWLGSGTWSPDQIINIWKQASTGKIPVSGAGYGGPFSGKGFDSMWTDMSEIVRPTRDGIHGREYISTSVDVGAKLPNLMFDPSGGLMVDPPPMIELPVPFVIQQPEFGDVSIKTLTAMAIAARRLNTLLVISTEYIRDELLDYADVIAPRIKGVDIDSCSEFIKKARMVEVANVEDVSILIEKVKAINENVVVSIRHKLNLDSEDHIVEMVLKGAEVIHLIADLNGEIIDGGHIKDSFRRIHTRLVDENLRDRTTLMASGGIAMAEHMAKIIICGADVVSLGMPFMVGMECRMCMNCENGMECPVDMANIPAEYGATRITNLAAAWRNQLLEVLGAMGIREVRRLRGEFGRAMFMEDLERETFGRLFGGKEVAR